MIKNTANLLNLQNLMKRDPQSYLEEFRQQQRHFQANLHIFHNSLATAGTAGAAAGGSAAAATSGAGLAGGLASTAGTSGSKQHKFHKDFGGLVTFLAHVSPCFPTEAGQFPLQLLDLLANHHAALDPPLRKTVVSAAILLQNRGMLDRMTLLPILFRLFQIQDKQLRLLLFHHIIADIKRINLKRAPGYVRVNSQLQHYMYTMLGDKASPLAAKKSLDVMIDLWRRKIWNDSKTVHAVQHACFSRDTRIKVTSLRFFLGLSFYSEEEEEEEEEEKATIRAKLSVTKTAQKGVVKSSKRKKKEREMKRAQKKMNREDTGKGHSSVVDDCPAIFLLHDPQSFAERLFSMVRHSNESFAVRMLVMNVISRLVGAHKLVLLNFYPFLQKYMQPHQKNVTHILTYLAQASHPLVPPDVLAPCVRTLANHFVNDRSSPEVTAVGLNSIREICARAPLVMDSDLLWDLVAYKKDKHKGVMMASRSLIALFRDINPTLLMRKERGRDAADFDEASLEFGSFLPVRTDIVGADLLASINTVAAEDGEDEDGDANMQGGRRKALADDGWDLAVGKQGGGGRGGKQADSDDSDADNADEDDDDRAGVAEINRYLRAVKHPEAMAKGDKKSGDTSTDRKKRRRGKLSNTPGADRSDDEEEEEGDEEMEEMSFSEGEEGEDAEGEGEGEEDAEEEEGSGDEMEMEEDDGEDEEEEEDEDEEEEEEPTPASKKRRTAAGAVASKKGQSKVSAAEDEEDEGEHKSNPADAGEGEGQEEEKKSALPVGATRIFTPKDFAEIAAARLAFHSNKRGKSANDKRKREDGTTLLNKGASGGGDEDDALQSRARRDVVGDVVSAESIVGWKSRKRMSKEERLASVMEGREGGVNSKKKGGGSTNIDKNKAKPFQLTKHSDAVHRKKQRSFSQQQKAFSGHIKTMQGMGKKIKNKMKKRKSSKMQSGGK